MEWRPEVVEGLVAAAMEVV
jgi:hypothetical protein